ncbi:Disintegrin and metalloproteinase domain-containing protein 23, partial [Exaiptasia diaphana]
MLNPNVATTLKPFDDHCIVPADETCKLQENNEIIFRSHDKCDQKYQEFRLDANGVLWHECSQRRVCPESETPSNSDRLVISSTCKDDNSKFVRTPGNSLKHVKSGKCIHPRGGRPGDGRKLVLYDGCDVTRLEIWFIKPDCIRPLGIQDGTISDSQITATSYRSNDKPFYARLHNGSYWCTRHNDKNQHLQIDLGKTMRITRVATQGRGTWWYDWVTGYYLSYSQDGQRWTGYSESGDKNHSNSYCYLGKCAETRDTECRDLWGPATDSASQACWNTLNTEAKGYGTCDAASNSTCAIEDVFCGQLQCSSQANRPVIDYGQSYKKIVMQDSSKCSGAILKQTDNVGQGMVRDGTKCGDKKMCMKSKCRTFQELNIKSCPVIDGYECSGRG